MKKLFVMLIKIYCDAEIGIETKTKLGIMIYIYSKIKNNFILPLRDTLIQLDIYISFL